MKGILIAPCGMNCGLCSSYLAMVHDLKRLGIMKTYCPGCRPRGKNCAFMKKQCKLLGSGQVRYCFECGEFPCRILKHLDQRYRERYRMSMIENLTYIKKHGIRKFLKKEADKWRCSKCGDVVCCHNGICFKCGQEKLKAKKKKYQWDKKGDKK
ncbi:MAG: DUF3795 domain-containing protein [bacterium]|nr:DUF3795 domain-containing protein [bacterium]